MTILQAIFLGALQGVAEFLPISSSGHLALCKTLFGLEEVPLLFDIMLHVATLAAVIIFFQTGILAFALFHIITALILSLQILKGNKNSGGFSAAVFCYHSSIFLIFHINYFMYLNMYLIFFEKNLMFYDKKVLTNIKCYVIVAIVIGARWL